MMRHVVGDAARSLVQSSQVGSEKERHRMRKTAQRLDAELLLQSPPPVLKSKMLVAVSLIRFHA